MDKKLILERRALAYATLTDLPKRAKEESRAMSADENAQWDKANADFDKYDADLSKLRRLDDLNAQMGNEEAEENKFRGMVKC